jgi:hypothetical protein
MTSRAGYRTIRIAASTKPTIAGVLQAVGELRSTHGTEAYI